MLPITYSQIPKMLPLSFLVWLPLLLFYPQYLAERTCSSSQVCRKAKSCSWYNAQIAILSQLVRNSQEHRTIKSQLKETVCNAPKRKICCPRSARPESKFLGRSCYGANGAGTCKRSSQCSEGSLTFSRSCGLKLKCCSRNIEKPRKTSAPTKPAENLPYDGSVNVRGCGTDLVDFIFGGQVAEKGAFPFMASFVYTNLGNRIESFCGGVLITQRHILTAAHCFSNVDEIEWKNGDIDVRLGLINIRKRERPLAKASIRKVKIHEDYKQRAPGYDNPIHDIAVVTLDRDIELGHISGITTVCLPSGREDISSRANRTAVVLGWGATERSNSKTKVSSNSRLNFAYIKEYSRRDCNNKYKHNTRSRVAITEDMICAGNQEADACAGDSGGPLLYVNDEFKYMASGIVTFGPNSCGSAIPGVYTKVQNYLGWIQQETQ